MKRNLLFTVLLAAIALATVAFSRPAHTLQDADETQLARYMEDINKTLRDLRRTLRDPSQQAESLKMTRSLQLWVVQAKNETPSRISEIPEAERATYVTDYARAMCEFLDKLVELEVAILDGKADAAQELRNEINKLKSPAHEKFRVQDDDEKEPGSEQK